MRDDLEKERARQLFARFGSALGSGPYGEGVCEHCKVTTQVSKHPSRTNYSDESQNVTPVLCDKCASDYHAYWDDMWEEYYRNVI